MTTKAQIRIATLAGLLLSAGLMESPGQNLVQNLTINLVAFDHVASGQVRITTRDVITYFAQTNIPGARLQLVTPGGNPPGTLGNLNAFLRVVKGEEILFEVPSPTAFNLYQDFAAIQTVGTRTSGRTIDRFSFEFGLFQAELQGFSTWNFVERTVDGVSVSGSGAFVSTVNGAVTVDGVTDEGIPTHGTIGASAPRPGP